MPLQTYIFILWRVSEQVLSLFLTHSLTCFNFRFHFFQSKKFEVKIKKLLLDIEKNKKFFIRCIILNFFTHKSLLEIDIFAQLHKILQEKNSLVPLENCKF
jgi:hypothetical protein